MRDERLWKKGLPEVADHAVGQLHLGWEADDAGGLHQHTRYQHAMQRHKPARPKLCSCDITHYNSKALHLGKHLHLWWLSR